MIQFGYLDAWAQDSAGSWRATVLLDEEPLEDVTLVFPASVESQLVKGMRVLVSYIGESNSDVIALVVNTRNAATDSIELRVGDTVLTIGSDSVVITSAEIKLGSSSASELVAFQSAIQALADELEAWVPQPNDGGNALKLLLIDLLATGWPIGATKTRAE